MHLPKTTRYCMFPKKEKEGGSFTFLFICLLICLFIYLFVCPIVYSFVGSFFWYFMICLLDNLSLNSFPDIIIIGNQLLLNRPRVVHPIDVSLVHVYQKHDIVSEYRQSMHSGHLYHYKIYRRKVKEREGKRKKKRKKGGRSREKG